MRSTFLALLLLLAASPLFGQSFKQRQLKFPRVRAAFVEKEAGLKAYCREHGFPYPPQSIFLRIFKKEAVLEVWARGPEAKYRWLKTYDICSSSGELGPKRKRGDLQVPEGFYHINDFNPQSNFHLSLGVSYPNRSDLILTEGRDPGGAIYIHGSCVTIGCLPITDDKIKELYVLAVEARTLGQQKIPVHIFPCRLDRTGLALLEKEYASRPGLLEFWRNLALGYRLFEEDSIPPQPWVDKRGKYIFTPRR